MKVTVCQMHDNAKFLEQDWRDLVGHLYAQHSELVLLPEMPFYGYFMRSPHFDPDIWEQSVEAHDRWEVRLPELQVPSVIGTRPIDFGNERYNEGFVWSAALGVSGVHAKARLQCEGGAWECRWYAAEKPEFVPVPVGAATVGFLIGREVSAIEEARHYRAAAVDLLVTPRMSDAPAIDQWLAISRETAVLAGAYLLSSGRASKRDPAAGRGWIIDPDGGILAMTSGNRPFASVAIDLPREQVPKQGGGMAVHV